MLEKKVLSLSAARKIVVDGLVVGAVGVSGDTPQVDEDIAIAGSRVIR